MSRRMIDDSMWANERFAELPMGARLLQIGIINHADDQGRMKANPIYLRAQIFPYDDISPKQIQEWLDLMAENGTVILYEVDSRLYVQLVNWWRYQSLQYAQPSQYPRPSGWKDRIRRTLTKGMIVTCNWQKVNGEPIDDTCDQNGNALNGRKPGNDHRGPSTPPLPDTDPYCTPEETVYDSHDSGEYSGESTPEGTNKLNITKLNENRTTGAVGVVVGGSELPKVTAADVHTLWQNNMPGSMSPIIADELDDLISTYTPVEVDTAIRLAVGAGKRNVRYVAGILRRRAAGEDKPQPAQVAQKVPVGVSGNLGFSLASI